jgi:CBS domain-containing protein
MLVKEVISKNIFFCTPSDTAQTAARTMEANGVGALPVVSDSVDRKLEGIITDRDLCCGVVATAKLAEAAKIADLMTRNPITCEPENTLEDCEELMQKHQIRRLPVIDKEARCIGMIAQADIALHAPAAKAGRTLAEISKPAMVGRQARAAGG